MDEFSEGLVFFFKGRPYRLARKAQVVQLGEFWFLRYHVSESAKPELDHVESMSGFDRATTREVCFRREAGCMIGHGSDEDLATFVDVGLVQPLAMVAVDSALFQDIQELRTSISRGAARPHIGASGFLRFFDSERGPFVDEVR